MRPDQSPPQPSPGESWETMPGGRAPGEIPPPPPPPTTDPAVTAHPAIQQPVFSWNQQHWQQQQLERELAAAREVLQAMHELLEELPEIFERKFQGRMQPLLQEQHRLLRDNASLRQQLLQLQPQSNVESGQPLLPAAAEDGSQPLDTGGQVSPSPRSRWSWRLMAWLQPEG